MRNGKKKVWHRKAALSVILLGALMMTGCKSDHPKTGEGFELVANKEYSKAINFFEEAKGLGEEEKLILRGEGIAYLGMNDYDNAIASLKAALACSDGFIEKVDYDINLYLATAYGKAERWAEAKDVCDAILDLDRNQKDALFLRGSILMAMNQVNNAQTDFDQLVQLDATNFDTIIRIYEVLEQYGFKELGRNYLQSALDHYGDKMDAYDTGRIYFYMEQYQQAYLALESAKDKGGAEASLFLGKSYEATGDYDYASRIYLTFLDKEGESAAIYNQLGMCYMRKLEYQQALDVFAKGMAMEKNDCEAELLYNQAICYENLHDFGKAKELLQKYLKLSPNDDKAKREMNFLATR